MGDHSLPDDCPTSPLSMQDLAPQELVVPAQVERLAWLTPARRQRLYVILTATVPILVVYGVVDGQSAALWVALAGAVLGTSTAAMHVNRGGGQ